MTTRSAIKTCLFDLGNVLIFFSHPRMQQQLSELSGLTVEQVQALLLAKQGAAPALQWRYEAGEISTDELIAVFARHAPRRITRSAWLEAMSDIFTANEAMLPILAELKARRYRLVIVSNTNEAHMDFAQERFTCFRYFDQRIFSYEIGAVKPEVDFYRAAQRAAQAQAAECLFIDDLPENISGAKEFGFQTALFTDVDAFRVQLAESGIILART